jgi:hypothetical protein
VNAFFLGGASAAVDGGPGRRRRQSSETLIIAPFPQFSSEVSALIPLLALVAGCSAELDLDPGSTATTEALSIEANEVPRANRWRVEADQHPVLAAQPTLIASNTPERSFIFGGCAYVLQDNRIAVVEARDPARFCGMITPTT